MMLSAEISGLTTYSFHYLLSCYQFAETEAKILAHFSILSNWCHAIIPAQKSQVIPSNNANSLQGIDAYASVSNYLTQTKGHDLQL